MRHSTLLTLLLEEEAQALPLDGVPGVSGAWSFQPLLSSYTGPAAKVKRASDQMELDVGLGETQDLAEFLSETTGSVLWFYDQSGNDRHFFQDVAGLEPGVSASVANGLPGLTGDGVGWLRSNYDLPHAATLMIAYSDHVADNLYGSYMSGFYPSIDTNRWRLNSGGPAAFMFAGGEVLANHNIASLVWDYDADIYKAYLGGTLVVDETTAVDYPLAGGNPGQLMLMATKSDGLDPLQGNILSVVLLDGVASSAVQNQVAQVFADIYGFSWASI